jgi:aminopeptidase N
MKVTYLLPLVLLTLWSTQCPAEENESDSLECLKSARFLAPIDSPDHRKYAADREVQALDLQIEVTPDFQRRTIEGQVTHRFKTLLKPVREVKLDAVDLDIHTVTSTEKIEGYQVTADRLVITFAEPIAPQKEASLTISYGAEPTSGLYFRTPEMGYKPGDTHLFSQGEEIEARHWYPCFDSPNTKFTSEVTCHVPEGMTVISNGRLVSQTKDASTGLEVFHWSQEQPHANYLITLAAGYFKVLEDKHRDVPLTFYTPASEIEYAKTSFESTKDIMAYFEEEIGVPYPWPKYAQVCVNDFVAGGMENTSATTLTDSTLFTPATENLQDSDGLVAHEMAHQWFGDLVTCKDWSDTWLNEGFATYYETLWAGRKHGRDQLLYELYERARHLASIPDDVNPIVRRDYNAPFDMFGYQSYPKGSWVLHMLRSQLGEDLYRRCIKTYLERHRYGSVVTEDLRAVIEELSGHSYDQFFDQWVYHAHQPELEASYHWDEKTKLAQLSIKQNQKLSENVLLFNFPLTVRFKSSKGTADRTAQVTRKEEDFYFGLEAAPEAVRLDPEYTILAKVAFNVPAPMLRAQLKDQADVIGRLQAIEQYADKHDQETIAILKQTMNEDPFYGVRIAASRALRSAHTDRAREALEASLKQTDARVRNQVVSDLGSFYWAEGGSTAGTLVEGEHNPEIQATAIRSMGAYAQPQVQPVLLKYLKSDSYRNELANAAIGAMRDQDDPTYISPLVEVLGSRETNFTSFGFARGLGALAYLARNQENKDQVREFLLREVNHKKRAVRVASIDALGTLGDPKALAVLEKFAAASKENREQAAAERAVTTLRAGRKPVDDFKNLRQEVLDLQKANRDLRKEMDELKKKLEALPPAAGTNRPATKKPVMLPPKH